ncbi:hypothetical protein A9995_14845 [Erythrobacter sp. QSSC1-22B]|nr:hypothetical protein A9995_14845 [Erythrobacter sp. QSSC1-22B]
MSAGGDVEKRLLLAIIILRVRLVAIDASDGIKVDLFVFIILIIWVPMPVATAHIERVDILVRVDFARRIRGRRAGLFRRVNRIPNFVLKNINVGAMLDRRLPNGHLIDLGFKPIEVVFLFDYRHPN